MLPKKSYFFPIANNPNQRKYKKGNKRLIKFIKRKSISRKRNKTTDSNMRNKKIKQILISENTSVGNIENGGRW